MFFWKMENVNLKQFESLSQKRLLGCVFKKKKRKKRRKRKRREEEREVGDKDSPDCSLIWITSLTLIR